MLNVIIVGASEPPAGGKCQSCWGRPKGYAGFVELFESYKRNAKKNKRKFAIKENDFKFLLRKDAIIAVAHLTL